MPPRILRPRQSTGFSDYMGELDEENYAHSGRLREREEVSLALLATLETVRRADYAFPSRRPK